jgi:branched-subunit amino acid transport protein
VTWTAVAILALGTFALRAAGLFFGRTADQGGSGPSRGSRVIELLPAALLAALVALQTFTAGGGLALDARAVGVAAAAIAILLRAPFALVVAIAAGAAAMARLLS